MQIVDGVRYSDQDVRDFGLTGGRTAPEGDRELTRTTIAVGLTAPTPDEVVPHLLATEDPTDQDGVDPDATEAGTEAAAKPARRAR